jgi:hypothetical protein
MRAAMSCEAAAALLEVLQAASKRRDKPESAGRFQLVGPR